MKWEKLIFSRHAITRMFERGISKAQVKSIVLKGEVIENYPKDTPYPSFLVLGFVGAIPLHVVAAQMGNEELVIITVYRPDSKKWDISFKKRVKL